MHPHFLRALASSVFIVALVTACSGSDDTSSTTAGDSGPTTDSTSTDSTPTDSVSAAETTGDAATTDAATADVDETGEAAP